MPSLPLLQLLQSLPMFSPRLKQAALPPRNQEQLDHRLHILVAHALPRRHPHLGEGEEEASYSQPQLDAGEVLSDTHFY